MEGEQGALCEGDGENVTGKPPIESYRMRAPCAACGSEIGTLTETGAQDVVRCICGKFQYNAPRVETGKAVRSTSTVHAAIKAGTRASVLIRGNCRCEICGKRVTDTTTELHVGHVVSVKRGIEMGLSDAEINDEENLMSQCAECNLGMAAEPLPLRLLVNVLMARLRRSKK